MRPQPTAFLVAQQVPAHGNRIKQVAPWAWTRGGGATLTIQLSMFNAKAGQPWTHDARKLGKQPNRPTIKESNIQIVKLPNSQMTMGRNPAPPVNIPIPTKMDGAPSPKCKTSPPPQPARPLDCCLLGPIGGLRRARSIVFLLRATPQRLRIRLHMPWGSVATIKTMGIHMTPIVYLRIVIIQIGSLPSC